MQTVPILTQVLKLNISERLFIMNKIYESLLNDLPLPANNNELIPEWLKKNLDEQTKEYEVGKMHTYSWNEVLEKVNEQKQQF